MDMYAEEEAEGPDADEVVMQLLQALAKKARTKRAESVLHPKQEAAPAVEGEASEGEMAELEAMLAEGEGEMAGPCESCGKGPGECAC